jgi:hypothetical protein
MVGRATRTYERAKPIIESKDEKPKDSVITGRQSISSAYNEIKKQEKIQQLIEEAKKRLAGNNNKFPTIDDRINLILGDMRSQEVNEQIADNSVDCIFTDPPYAFQYLPLWEDIGKLAMRVLKPGASLITMTGGYPLQQIMNLVTKSGMNLNWYCYMRHIGRNKAMHLNHVTVCLLWFYKGEKLIYTSRNIPDYLESEQPVTAPMVGSDRKI